MAYYSMWTVIVHPDFEAEIAAMPEAVRVELFAQAGVLE